LGAFGAEQPALDLPLVAIAQRGGELGLGGRAGGQVDEGGEELSRGVPGPEAKEITSSPVGAPDCPIAPQQEHRHRRILEHDVQQSALGVQPVRRRLGGRLCFRLIPYRGQGFHRRRQLGEGSHEHWLQVGTRQQGRLPELLTTRGQARDLALQPAGIQAHAIERIPGSLQVTAPSPANRAPMIANFTPREGAALLAVRGTGACVSAGH
jgi:hypothetical protein